MKTILLCACLLFATISNAQRFWVGGTSTDWNNAANWSTTSGGAGGASVPGLGSQVTIDRVTLNNCILTTAVTISQFTQSAGVFSLGAGGSLTVTSPFTVSGGIFNAGPGTLSVPSNTFTMSGGVFNGGSATINIGGNVSINDPLFYIRGTSTLVFNGASDQDISVTYTTSPHVVLIYKLVLNKPGTTLRFNAPATDTTAVEDSIILINGKMQGTGNLKALANVWVQSGFDGSAIPLTSGGANNTILRLDTIFATDVGSSLIVKKTIPTATLSVLRTNPADTVRTGNFNADLVVASGILQFPDNPPVQSRFRNIFIQPGGTLLAPANYFYNAGAHINTGGTFVHNNGTYVFYQPGIPALTQFTSHVENFNNLVIDIAGGQFNPGPNDTLVVNGDLTLKGGLITGGSLSALNVKGNFNFEAGMSPTHINTKLLFSGTGNQNVSFAAGAGANWNSSVTINKPGGLLILNSSWTLDESNQFFTFTKGIMQIPDTANNYLYFTSQYLPVGASAASYVDGPVRVKRWASDPFEFPIGNAGFYGPIRVSQFWAASEDLIFSGQYFHKASEFATDPSKDPTLANIGKAEWWSIKRITGNISAPPYLWLSFDNVRSGGVTDPSKLRVTRRDGLVATWQDRGNGEMNGNFIRSTQPVGEFSPFTLASTDPVANPLVASTLPVHLVSFTAEAKDGYTLLEWTASNEINFDSYTIESSTNGISFTSRGNIKAIADGLLHRYSFNAATTASKTFYRLKLLDRNGRFEYSNVVVVNRSVRGITIVLSPNPGREHFTVIITSEFASAATIQLSDAQGKLLRKEQTQIKNGVNSFDMEAGELPRGIYFIEVTTSRGERQVQRYSVMK